MRKKAISLILALVLVLGLVPAASAASSGTCGSGVNWALSNSGQLTISGQGKMQLGSVESTPWYQFKNDITSIVIKSGVTVCENAFWNCLKVESLVLEEGASMDVGAFASMGSREKGCRVTLPSTITELPDRAFDLSFISSINIPSGVTSIGDQAFEICGKLTSITIPASVKTIGTYAFRDCEDLTSITLLGVPDSVEADAFAGVPSSGTFNFNGTREQWDALSARWEDRTTEQVIFGATPPTVNILVDSPKVPYALKLNTSGVVEISADNTDLAIVATAPVGSRLSDLSLTLYTEDGTKVGTIRDGKGGGTFANTSSNITYTLWKTPQDGKLDFSSFSLTLGETYRYEFQAMLDGTSYTTGLGTLRLAGAKNPTYFVSFSGASDFVPILVTNGQPYGKLPEPTRSGYTFEGWYTASSGGSKVTESTIASLTGDQTLYARWTQEAAPSLTHASTPTNGVVVISAQNSQLKATFSAPKGKNLTQWDVTIYNTDGSTVGRMVDNNSVITSGESGPLAIYLWTEGGTPKEGQVLDYGQFKLTVGTVYEYEFSAVVDGTTYRTGKAKFRLSATAPQTTGTAYASTQKVLVDGRSVEFQAYALKDANGYDTNYVKLRDVAVVLNGTAAQFEVGWDGAVNIETGKAYTANGTEMHTPFSGNRRYTDSATRTLVNGKGVAMDAILLQDDAGNGYTYYKLRDLGAALGFKVDWTAEKGIFIETE